jgi:hypothetical protein
MKTPRLAVLAILLLISSVAFFAYAATAPETYSITISSQADLDKLDLGRVQHNTDVCVGLGLAANCAQGDACVAKGVPSGQSCTAAEANAYGCRIYANTTGGRGGFINIELLRARLDEFQAEQRRRDTRAAAMNCEGFTRIQKDAVCAAYGLSSGCTICD